MPPTLSAAEREPLILEYERGASLLRAAWQGVPEPARQWPPAPGKWSAHEVVVHCADSETYAATRIRLVVAEADPLIVGYQQDAWARVFEYHSRSADLALEAVDAVRANTVPILRILADANWSKTGRHTETGAYTACDWLSVYAPHLTSHARQIERNVAAWRSAAR